MKGHVTAADLLAQLDADPVYLAARANDDVARRRREQTLSLAETPLVTELRSAGVEVSSVWDLHGAHTRSPAVLAVLADHLSRRYPRRVRMGIAYALATRAARPYWKLLRERYEQDTDEAVKDAIATALAAVATDETIDELADLVRNSNGGPSRLLLLPALRRFGMRGRDVLESLHSDPELSAEAIAQIHETSSRRPERHVSPTANESLGPDSPQETTSLSLDRSELGSFFARLVKDCGLIERDKIRVVDEIGSVGTESSIMMDLDLHGKDYVGPLRVEAFADDADTFDVYLFAPKKLAADLDAIAGDFTENR